MAPSPSSRWLAVGWLPRHSLAVSPWDGSLTIRYLAGTWLPSHLLAVSPWDGSLATHSLSHRGKTSSPSASRPLRLHKEIPSLSARHLAVRRFPAGRPPVGRLFSGRLLLVDYPPLADGHCLNSAISLLECTALFQTALSLSFFRMSEKALVVEYTGMFYLFLARHHSWGWPLNWRRGSCDVRGITGCIILGAAASGYSMKRDSSIFVLWSYCFSLRRTFCRVFYSFDWCKLRFAVTFIKIPVLHL